MRMALQQTAAATTTAESSPSLGSKSWDLLYPPHVLGEALKQIQGSLQDRGAAATGPGTIQEKQQQQMLSRQEQQQSQLLVQAATASPAMPLGRKDERQQSSEGGRPLLEPSTQQQQIQPQQQPLVQLQQAQRLQLHQLQQFTPPASELQRSPSHRLGLVSQQNLLLHPLCLAFAVQRQMK